MSQISEELPWMPAWRIAELVRSRAITAPEVIEVFLDRISRVDDRIHSFITVCADEARARALEVQASIDRGDDPGVLCGVPFSVKDNILTRGVRTTFGSKLFEDYVPDSSSVAIDQLSAAGAILVGKTNLPEFSSWGRSLNRVSDECVNPWDTGRTSGASSGGAAAGVAAGLVPIAVGSDDGGSIRLPSAFNGVFGLFPSRGQISLEGAVVNGPMSAIGPITRNVRDAILAFEVMARAPHPNLSADSDPRHGMAGLRIAWLGEHSQWSVSDERVIQLARETAFSLVTSGALLEAVKTPFKDPWGSFGDRAAGPAVPVTEKAEKVVAYALPVFADAMAQPDWQDRIAPYMDPLLLPRKLFADVQFEVEPVESTAKPLSHLAELLASFDLVVTPTIDQIAPRLPAGWSYPYGPEGCSLDESRRRYTKFTLSVNLDDCAAASVPCGFVDGMPVGLQIVGRRGDEAAVFRASRAIEATRPWAGMHPF